MPEKVRKKDGRLEKFSRDKLLKSIILSMRMAGFTKTHLAPKIADDAMTSKKPVIDSIEISDAVCASLKKNKHHELCDAYSLVWLHAKTKIKSVVKKHGGHEKFSPEKLSKSVQKSFKGSYTQELHMLQPVVKEVISVINKKHSGKSVSSEEIRNIVVSVLNKKKLSKVVHHYISYKYR